MQPPRVVLPGSPQPSVREREIERGSGVKGVGGGRIHRWQSGEAECLGEGANGEEIMT